MPSETVRLQKEYIDNVLKIDYDLDIWSTSDEEFWVSKIQLRNFGKAYPAHATTLGKGRTKDECLASNYGEFLEKLVWLDWKSKNEDEEKIPARNMKTNEYELLDMIDLKKYFWDASKCATGNNIEEARYHTILDVLELGQANDNNAFPFFPLETNIAKTENMFPNIPKKYHDNTQILIQRDPRIPSVYIATCLRAPNEKDVHFMQSLSEKKGREIKFNFNEVPKTWSPMLSNFTGPWPPYVGRRFGLDLNKVIPIAMAEMIQVYKFYDQDSDTEGLEFYFPEGEKKKTQSYWPIIDAKNFSNNEKETIEEDNQTIIDEMAEAGFNSWEIDVTPQGSPMSAVKIISDYTFGRWTPGSKELLNKLFYF